MSRDLNPNNRGRGRGRGQGRGQRRGRWQRDYGRDQVHAQEQGRVHREGREQWGQGQQQNAYSGSHRGPRSSSSIKYLSRDDITALAQSTSDDILTCVNQNESGFLAAYRNDKFCQNPLMLKHLIKILYLLSKHDDFNRVAPRILARILSADGQYALFIMRLDFLIKEMVTEQRGHIRRENPQYINYLLDIGSKAITTIPETVLNTYPLLVIQRTIKDLIKQGDSLDTLERKVESLEEAFKLAREERLRVPVDIEDHTPEPPKQFVDVDILPDRDEVHSKDEGVYLRPNIVKGRYKNWDHYLDIQYRLLREDFLRPLRHGIQQYSSRSGKMQDLRIYSGVRVLNPVCLFTGIGFQIQFNASNFSRVKWEYSRRLIFGSLLCLSDDSFEHSVIFATVMKRDPDLLKEGCLIVKFEGDVNGFQLDPNKVFTMAETTAYFEAYRHVLEKLKEISSIKEEIPFKRYIIDSKLNDIPPPSYLHHKGVRFDLRSILNINSVTTINSDSSWPSPEDTCLDESQLEAIKMALTKELSVIQGPPGTGKTFIGLKIVEALLRNRSVWDRNRDAPILVVCYTNHALDQFLEGIHSMCVDKLPPNIIRVGGRCKSEMLSNYILRNKVKECMSAKSVPGRLHSRLSASRDQMFSSRNTISDLLKHDTEGQHFVGLSELFKIISEQHIHQLIHSERGKEIEVWLELWYPTLNEPGVQLNQDIEARSNDDVIQGSNEDLDAYIDVDNEVQLMEEERILEGEEILFSDSTGPKAQQRNDKRFHARESQVNKDGWTTIQIDDAKRNKLIKEGLSNESMTVEEVDQIGNIWHLSLKQRWQLYCFWLKEYAKYKHDEAKKISERYEDACERYSDSLKELDEYILCGTDVIGMTTTGAAKHHHFLKKIHPKVVIFEEAAEIFEAHVITSLAPSVQQLILIGDHKQLRPKPNSYDLEVKYGLAVSLFERLIKNEAPYVTLGVQHRMRPEISRLIHPSIYSDLKNHASVTEFEHIRGVAKDVFMIDHKEPEQSNNDSDATTHVNEFEADYVVALCRYLLKQGYQPCHITILTMYRGQLLKLKQKMRRTDFNGVRVAAVDDFQGEENDIILLSLVRSNSDGIIGFLGNPNRICVSLSRARKGFYVIGNLAMLRDKDSTKWPEIISDLEQRQCVAAALPLYCQVHREKKVYAAVPEDFSKCPEGGCDKMCGARLDCGHVCPRVCHPVDSSHSKYKCSKPCSKTLPCGHQCQNRCHDCNLRGCGRCKVNVEKVMPSCRHKVKMPCNSDPKVYSCPILCGKTLHCGHPCQNLCSDPCTLKCKVKVEKTLQCGHDIECFCHELTDSITCPEKCSTLLDCGHPCVGTCGECYLGRLHVRCHQNCGRQLVCGHTCNYPCASTCPPCMAQCNNSCVHSHCPKRCYEICTPCMEPCQWRCKHYKCTQRCGELCNRPPCNKPCEKILKCGHPCISLCGETCPKFCRVCNEEEVCEVFFGTEDDDDARFIMLSDCGHLLEVCSLDKWIEAESNQPGIVQFKTCPKCKTPIRKSLRYCNEIKQILKDVEEIKRRQFISKNDLMEKLKTFERGTQNSSSLSFIESEIELLKSHAAQENLHPYRINAMLVQITILNSMLDVCKIISTIKQSVASQLVSNSIICDLKSISNALEGTKRFIMQDFLSQQQVEDAVCECRRLSCAAKLCDLLCKLHDKNCKLNPNEELSISHQVKVIHESGWKRKRMDEEHESAVLKVIKDISETYHVDGLSVKERNTIVSAIGLPKGHWFKCPNGHLYCIGECGGAMETSKCPECGETIGGQQHTLTSGNVHAPEIDGSSHPAWSEAANLANFDLNQLHF